MSDVEQRRSGRGQGCVDATGRVSVDNVENLTDSVFFSHQTFQAFRNIFSWLNLHFVFSQYLSQVTQCNIENSKSKRFCRSVCREVVTAMELVLYLLWEDFHSVQSRVEGSSDPPPCWPEKASPLTFNCSNLDGQWARNHLLDCLVSATSS